MSTDISSTEAASTKLARSKSKYQDHHEDLTLVEFASPLAREELRALLPELPETRSDRSEWMRELARDATLSIAQTRSLGANVSALETAFDSLLTGEPQSASLVRGQTGEVVCRDRSEAGTYFVYTTLPELLASQVAGCPTKLRKNHHVEWRVRLLAHADLLELPAVDLRPLPPGMRPHVEVVYEGLRLLFACRWFLEYGEPAPFSATFIQTWCGVTEFQARDARDVLGKHVLRGAGTIPSGRPSPTRLFLPMEVE